MESLCFFLLACAICLAANGTPQVFRKPFGGHFDENARQYYAVEYLGNSRQNQPGQDYNLNHGEVDAPNEDIDENIENFSYNNGFVEIAHDEEFDSPMMPYVENAASNGELIPEDELSIDDDEEDDEDTQGEIIIVEGDPDKNGNENQSSLLGAIVNETNSSEESTSDEPMTEEHTEYSIDLETYGNSSKPDQIISAFVHPIYRPSSEWPLAATQLGNAKPKPSKKPVQTQQQGGELHENGIRRKPQKNHRKRITIVKRRGGYPNRQNIRRPFRNANRRRPNEFFRRASSSSRSDSSSCGTCQCGVTTTRRIVGGKVAAVNELPWLALITYNDTIQCGGTLISDQLVLTAAHCVRGFDLKLFQLRFMEYDTNSTMDTVAVLRTISRMYSLKSYVAKTSEHDIAILRLSGPIDFETTTVRPICLPPNTMEFTGESGIIAGWGTEAEGDISSNMLRTTEVPIISNQQCLLVGMTISNNMLCAGRLLDGSIDACHGDSGGPLMVIRNKRYTLAGVISWGDGCARPLKTGIYTRVTKYLPWINKQSIGSCKCE